MAFVTHLLACIFGTGAWVAINGLWVELPLIVNDLPEGWYLPSYLTIIIQMANIGPLLVTLMHKIKPGLLKEVAVIYTIIFLGVVALFLLAFLWKETTWIAGRMHSTGFLTLTFFLSLVDCTSSVTFLPFMMQLQSKYITTYFIGEGLSGLIPGLLSLIQGFGLVKCVNITQNGNTTQAWLNATDNNYQIETQYLPANFSVQVFMFLLCIMMLFCLVAFFFLTRLSKKDVSNVTLCQSTITLDSFSTTDEQLSCNMGPSDTSNSTDDLTPGRATSSHPDDNVEFSWGHFALIYFLTGWVNALTNGVLPSIQTYSCMPYGNLAYHLSAVLGSMANPLACLIAMFLPNR
ncbi:hypothetical protein GDO78_004757 [Eleutherodactylus coqui]|uniref:Riboflavin transporter n=2 Tax=Eleutherodactylus coqui TaxID=57060 RepID=A0A8J6ESN8_ELECQ|nr:hypothetical protein GDO78_004757 [Eleutherodactylus coqui]